MNRKRCIICFGFSLFEDRQIGQNPTVLQSDEQSFQWTKVQSGLISMVDWNPHAQFVSYRSKKNPILEHNRNENEWHEKKEVPSWFE
jgi:hypothetical protein